MRKSLILCGCLVAVACRGSADSSNTNASPDPRSAAGYVVDSVFTMDEEMRRFRMGLTSAPSSLVGGANNAEELARDLVSAAAAGDTATLQRIHISKPEFAYLYFPDSRFARPPYELPPGLLWFQITAESNGGLTKLARKLAKGRWTVDKVECSSEPRQQNRSKLWENCLTHWHDELGSHAARLFGTILEWDGKMKLVSFANDL